MIVFLTSRGHGYTVKAFTKDGYAPAMPLVKAMCYEQAFWATRLPRATYIFTDIERLYGWEQRAAADLHWALLDAGMRCLNNPARVMTRYELLRGLHRAGFNPFTVHRADDDPQPSRFPVFIRVEEGHAMPLTGLLADTGALQAALVRLVSEGWARRLLLVVEFFAEPIAEGIWRKHGSLRIGEEILLDRNVIQDNWVVKMGTKGIWTEAMYQDENNAIAEKRYAAAVRPAFELAGIEYGRADHATINGQEVVYEINTNPYVSRENKQSPSRNAALAQSALYARDALRAIDCVNSGTFGIKPNVRLPKKRFDLKPRWISRP